MLALTRVSDTAGTVDLYRPLLAKALFPAYEAARGRPTVPLLRYLRETETWSPDQLRDLQAGLLRRLLRHAYHHTTHYRELFDDRGLLLGDFNTVEDLQKLPLLERPVLRASLDARTASAPPRVAITKTTSGSSGEPVTVKYNVESRYWRDAVRWRGYGWGGYEIGMRALHYWGFGVQPASAFHRAKMQLDRAIKRDLYIDCTPRDEKSFADAVAEIKRFKPHVIVAYAGGAAALARYVNATNARAWDDIPVLTGAEALHPHERASIEHAFGAAFDTYGCREVMMIGSECEQHDGMHTAMENMIVEIVVRQPDGTTRAAKPGELGEVVITDLHNLACPMIRYVNGDTAIARDDSRCACGRGLSRIGPIQGRITDTMYDGAGNPVGGLVFNILFATIGTHARSFQVHQRADRSVVLKIVPYNGKPFPEREGGMLRQHAAKYLPGAPFSIEVVDDIPLSPAGKRRVVVVDKAG
jgi:phenylacetate-CoA ligase